MRQTEKRTFSLQILMEFNSPGTILGLLLLLQIGGALVFALAGLYVLYCLNRAASGLDRMADVAEAWLLMQQHQVQQQAAREQNPAQAEIRPITMENPVGDSQNL